MKQSDKPNLGIVPPVVQASPLPPCSTCKWSVRHRMQEFRCHFNPPGLRLPHENQAVWPVIPDVGPTGCSYHEIKKDK